MLNTTLHAPRLTFTRLRHAAPASQRVQTSVAHATRIRRIRFTETAFRWGTAALLFSSGAVAARLLLWMGQ